MPIIIIGGPSATGKTCTAKKLKDLYEWDYIEADEYHPQSNIDKMHAGIPLTDEDRLPWLQSLHKQLEKYSSSNRSCIITCSALKKIYRQILLTGSTDPDIKVNMPKEDFYLIMLTLSKEALHKRLLQRQHEHFMHPALLESQLETLELPKNPEDEPYTYNINCDGLSQDEVVHEIQKIIKQ
jgi:carbohydrate kinase (thermoresistant glucokinase family)